MSSVARRYIRSVRKQWKFGVAWSPLQDLTLGDYGELASDGTFEKRGNLKVDFNIPITSAPPEGVGGGGELSLSSSKGWTYDTKLSGETSDLFPQIPQASAAWKATFDRTDTLFFELFDAEQKEIQNLDAVEEKVIKLYQEGDWNDRYEIVRSVITARGTILFTSSSSSSILVTAAANFKDVADVAAGFQIKSVSSGLLKHVGTSMTPLFIASRLKVGGSVPLSLGAHSLTPAAAKKHAAYVGLEDVAHTDIDEA